MARLMAAVGATLFTALLIAACASTPETQSAEMTNPLGVADTSATAAADGGTASPGAATAARAAAGATRAAPRELAAADVTGSSAQRRRSGGFLGFRSRAAADSGETIRRQGAVVSVPVAVVSRSAGVFFWFGYQAGNQLEEQYHVADRVNAWFSDLALLVHAIRA